MSEQAREMGRLARQFYIVSKLVLTCNYCGVEAKFDQSVSSSCQEAMGLGWTCNGIFVVKCPACNQKEAEDE